MPDIRIVDRGQNQGPISAASIQKGADDSKKNALAVVLCNASGDAYNGNQVSVSVAADGAIQDGSNASIRATVKQYTNSNPQAVVLVNASGDAYNGNQTSVVVNKWNLRPDQDSVSIDGGRIGVTGDVTVKPGTIPAGQYFPVSGDQAIVDGASRAIRATVKQYTNSNPQAVVLVNASGDAYNGNQTSVVVNKWNLTPTQDSVHLDGGVTGVTGDVSTIPKVGQTWPVSQQSVMGIQIVGTSVNLGVSGDTPIKLGTMPAGQYFPASGDFAQVDGANRAIKATVKNYTNSNPQAVVLVNASGDAYNGNQTSVSVNKWNLTPTQDAVHINSGLLGVSGDVSTIPKAGQTWPVSQQSILGVQVVGTSINLGVSGDTPVKLGTIAAGVYFPVSGDFALSDGATRTRKATVQGYTRANPLAVSITNASGDTINPQPREPTITTYRYRNITKGSTQLAGPYTGQCIKVVSYEIQSQSGPSGDTMSRLSSGASGDPLTIDWIFAHREGTSKAVSAPAYVCKTNAGQALFLEHFDTSPVVVCFSFFTGDAF